eukprot:2077412-Alexandrium_andersonii.AAC.1
MSASLVGSEMCIRDRSAPGPMLRSPPWLPGRLRSEGRGCRGSVRRRGRVLRREPNWLGSEGKHACSSRLPKQPS